MRSEAEIKERLNDLKKDLNIIRNDKDSYIDKERHHKIVIEYLHKIHTLEWILRN